MSHGVPEFVDAILEACPMTEDELVGGIVRWGLRRRSDDLPVEERLTVDGQFKCLVEESCEELYDYQTPAEHKDAIGDSCVTAIVQYDLAPTEPGKAYYVITAHPIKDVDERIRNMPVIWVGRLGRALRKGTPDDVRYACAGLYQAAKGCCYGRYDFVKDCLAPVYDTLLAREKQGYKMKGGSAIKQGDL